MRKSSRNESARFSCELDSRHHEQSAAPCHCTDVRFVAFAQRVCDGGRWQQGLNDQVAWIRIPSNGERLMSTRAVLECLRRPLAPALACKRCR